MHLNWHTSSYSGQHGGNCVEVAETPETVYVRDSQHPSAATLAFTPQEFAGFVHDLRDDRL